MSYTPYLHKVQYYETDSMRIVHHSNYIRWMEEARIDFMDQLGFPYTRMESADVFSPVKSLSCSYLHPSTFGDTVSISVSVEAFNGVVLTICYSMQNLKSGEQVCTARSEHVFLDGEGHFVRLRRRLPDFCDAIQSLIPGPDPSTSPDR